MPKTRRLSDATLVRRSQQGDRRAFGALVARYDRRLRGLAHALLLDRRQMDAALSMAYLRAWRDVVRVKPRDEVGPWLYRAAYNACIDQLRRAESPGDATAGLRSGLAGLAPADRVAVVLVEREGFTVASAARILGVSVDVIETRLDVARDHLAPWTPAPVVTPPAAVEAAAAAPAGAGETVAATSGAASDAGEPSVPVASTTAAQPHPTVDVPAVAGPVPPGAPDSPIPEPAAEGVRAPGTAEAPAASGVGATAEAPDLPTGDAEIVTTPPDLSEEIVIAAEDAAAARASASGHGNGNGLGSDATGAEQAGADPSSAAPLSADAGGGPGPAVDRGRDDTVSVADDATSPDGTSVNGAAAPGNGRSENGSTAPDSAGADDEAGDVEAGDVRTGDDGAGADDADDGSTVVLAVAGTAGRDRGRGRRARRRARYTSRANGTEGPGDDADGVSSAR